MYKAILYIAIAYILLSCLIMVTITTHIFISIFQMKYFSFNFQLWNFHELQRKILAVFWC